MPSLTVFLTDRPFSLARSLLLLVANQTCLQIWRHILRRKNGSPLRLNIEPGLRALAKATLQGKLTGNAPRLHPTALGGRGDLSVEAFVSMVSQLPTCVYASANTYCSGNLGGSQYSYSQLPQKSAAKPPTKFC